MSLSALHRVSYADILRARPDLLQPYDWAGRVIEEVRVLEGCHLPFSHDSNAIFFVFEGGGISVPVMKMGQMEGFWCTLRALVDAGILSESDALDKEVRAETICEDTTQGIEAARTKTQIELLSGIIEEADKVLGSAEGESKKTLRRVKRKSAAELASLREKLDQDQGGGK